MVVEEGTNNVCHVEQLSLVPHEKGATINGYAFENGSDNTDGNLEASSGEGFRTYKRRKHLKMSLESNPHDDGVSVAAGGQVAIQTIKEPQDTALNGKSYQQNGLPRIDSSVRVEDSDDCLQWHWRNVVLEHVSQSLDVSEGGVQSCIHNVFASNLLSFTAMFKTHGSHEQTAQESVRCHECRQKHKGVSLDGSQDEPNDQENAHVMTQLCQRVLCDILVSEKFALLCKLLCENFQGIKGDSFFDFAVINSRMKEGVYEQSPILFFTDIQQVWRKFQKIGTELVSLAKSLSDMSRTSYREQGLLDGTCEERKLEEFNQIRHEQKDCSDFVVGNCFPSQGSNQHTKLEKTEAYGLNKVFTCRQCGAKADGKDCLVCDSCEKMYHVSCIEPAVKEIPPRNWYCGNCTGSGIESPHENCVVCERLNDPKTLTLVVEDEGMPMGEELFNDSEDRSDCSMEALDVSDGDTELHCCKLCGSGEENGQKFRICEHPHCCYKYYHVRCLTKQQLKSYSRFWYCPSCLCRACLTDKDDDKIVLCDSCDHGYHIYCMKPPRTSIPRGKWFCSQCDAGIQMISRTKTAYENLEKRQRKNGVGGVCKAEESVDMLLSAAEKLKSEEKLATTGIKR